MDLIKIKMEANKINLENISEDFKFKESINNRTKETKTWISSKDKKDLNQLLKRIEVGRVVNDKNANGEIKIKILINTYLIE